MTLQVHLQLASKACNVTNIPAKESFYQWAKAVINIPTEIGVRIVDNSESQQLNRYFRNIDQATNVLSFPFSSEVPEHQNYLGDIVMAAPIIVLEAQQQNKSVPSHWAHLFIHALLHLQGYSHDNDFNRANMEGRESKIMTALGFPDPWICKQATI